MIYIPKGLPHGSDNQSGAPERHMEVLIPAVQPGIPFLRPVQSADEVQVPVATAHVTSSSGPPAEVSGHEKRWAITAEPTGAPAARLTAVEADRARGPGRAGQPGR